MKEFKSNMDEKIKSENQLFETSDFCLSTYLLYLGFKIWGLKEEKEGRKIFVFERDSGLDKAIEAFWKKEARVEPETFWLIAKSLKSRLYNANRH